MHHRLLVADQVIRDALILLQGLADAGDVSVPENSEATLKKPVLFSIALAVLVLEKCDHGLRHGEASSHPNFPRGMVPRDLLSMSHAHPLTRGSRGSVSFQVDRIQTWWGSSVMARVREVPARKFK